MNYFQKMNTFPYNLGRKREEERKRLSDLGHTPPTPIHHHQESTPPAPKQQYYVPSVEKIKFQPIEVTEEDRQQIRNYRAKGITDRLIEFQKRFMIKHKDIIGQKYELLTYIGPGTKKTGTVKCQCDCGIIKDIAVGSMFKTKSCGCLSKRKRK